MPKPASARFRMARRPRYPRKSNPPARHSHRSLSRRLPDASAPAVNAHQHTNVFDLLLAANTAMKEIVVMRGFFRFCVDRKWIEENPARRLKAPKSDRLPTLPFAPAEITGILDACKSHEIRALILTLLYSGLRISDAVQLRRD